MLYHLLFGLRNIFSPLNIFQYITFRAFGAIFTSFILTIILTNLMVAYMKRRMITQPIRDDGPATHHAKQGTPTMGGIAILVSMAVTTALWARLDNRFILWLLGGVIFLGMLGFADDYLKHVKKNSRGLSASKKLAGQIVLAVSVALYLRQYPAAAAFADTINIPYLKDAYIGLGALYAAFVVFVILGASNGVNFTDGLDGLAIGNLVVAAFTFSIFAYLAGNVRFAQYLKIIYVPGAGEITVYLAAMLGTGLGFLWYNTHPAQIFMGDTGSLFLGGGLGMVAVFIKQELLLVIIGGVFVAEVLSVILQVQYFKRTGKRIFRMAPLHHHYELGGLSEPKITVRFIIISIVLSLVALASLKLR
ncbi:MAG: phospho-N-acetylmuramoyl-pentapeptide-transferase [Elusimicrobia bacterium HGW-Elusimicrobia-1]|jgi:phospho-N-acetylmuramoyl-pentapeptide-transferase|nr:MAG: phospho-N-acetylmuramoyl-pentapeptide-transferase [Elusimicrobia bacterium HGW-Elusimicrobia-1]